MSNDSKDKQPQSPVKQRDALPVVKLQKAQKQAKIEDVRFTDEGGTVRVSVDLQGEAAYTVLHADSKTCVLRIAATDLPKKLERTLDVAAYRGPLKSVSTYTDPDDPGAVRVVANFDGEVTG